MEIRAGGARLTLGTFATVEQAARAYDVATWCLGQSAFDQQKKAERRAEKEAIRARKPFIEAWEAGPTTIGRNNERWADLVLTEPSESSGFLHVLYPFNYRSCRCFKIYFSSIFDLIFNHMYAKFNFRAVFTAFS
jgi:hypothetical protein